MTSDQLSALAIEIKNDPEQLGYAAHLPDSPGIVADLLNASTQSMVQAMTASRALVWGAQGAYAAIVDTGNNVQSPLRSSCLAFRDNIVAGRDIDLSDVDVQKQFDAWQAAGVITAGQHALAIAYATQPASRAHVLNLPPVTVENLHAAGVI